MSKLTVVQDAESRSRFYEAYYKQSLEYDKKFAKKYNVDRWALAPICSIGVTDYLQRCPVRYALESKLHVYEIIGNPAKGVVREVDSTPERINSKDPYKAPAASVRTSLMSADET